MDKMDKRTRAIDNWAQSTRALRQDITKRGGVKDTSSLIDAISRATGKKVFDPVGHDHRLKKNPKP
jgi:hypothetical protein